MNAELSEELVKMAEKDRAVRAALSSDGSLSVGQHPMMAELQRRNAERLSAILTRSGSRSRDPRRRLLFGVAPWLPALYFAFGVVVAALAETAAKDRQPSVRSSVSGTPAPH